MRVRTIIITGATVALVGGIFAWREYSRGHVDTSARDAVARVTAAELLSAFQADEQAATARYVGTSEQVIEVAGSIRSMEEQEPGRWNVVLETGQEPGVECELASVPEQWSPGASVVVKGICTGMDDLFGHIILQRGTATE